MKIRVENQTFFSILGGNIEQRLVLDAEGKLWIWGKNNSSGQLGIGTTESIATLEDKVNLMPEN